MLWYNSSRFLSAGLFVLHKNGRGVADLRLQAVVGWVQLIILLCLFLENKDKNYASMTRQKLI